MPDFIASWELCRSRFCQEIQNLTARQLRYQLHPGALTIGQMALHVAGVEIWFIAQLTGSRLSEEDARLARCATDGVVNNEPFPFRDHEITPGFVAACLDHAKALVQPHIENPSEEFLAKEIKSALGPMITGYGALARFAFHPGYHHGQAYQIITSPNFPPG